MLLCAFSPRGLASLALVLLCHSARAADRTAEVRATRDARAHLEFLGDDLLEGRGTGTRGYDLAAAYVAAQFKRLGLEPAGAGGTFRQPVRLLESTRDLTAARMTIHAEGADDVALQSPADFLARPAGNRQHAEIRAPVVFVGFGVHAPEHGYSDFEGVDLKGKIAVIVANAPAKLPGTARAHYSSNQTKTAELAQRGAIAILSIGTGGGGGPGANAEKSGKAGAEGAKKSDPPAPGAAWNAALAGARTPSMVLLNADGALADDRPEIQLTASLNPAHADKLFARSPRPYAELVAATRRSEPTSVPLGVELSIAAGATTRAITCHNVVAVLRGSDPALASDYLVVTSHLDHLGTTTPVNGDAIFNGVMDNAVGVTTLLAVAEHFVTTGARLRRPVLFAAVTAEEKGLLGSRHLSRNPPAGARFVANVNVDMGPFFAPLRAVIGYGSEHSTLGRVLDDVAARLGWAVRPDPAPAQRVFVRSDQYSFVREGVPAIFLEPAPESTDPAIDLGALNREFMRSRYHKRSDDLQQPIDWESIGAFAILTAEVTRTVANLDTSPAWLAGDFFGETFGKK